VDFSLGKAHCVYALCIARAATNANERKSLEYVQLNQHSDDVYIQETLQRVGDCIRMAPESDQARNFKALLNIVIKTGE